MIRILHISDLHFAAEGIQPRLANLEKALKKSLRVDVDIEIANSTVLDALAQLVGELDPDVIVISGDITTFGDEASYKMAHAWLLPLLTRAGGKKRTCVVVPGNHDVLSRQFAQLVKKHLTELPWYARKAARFYLRDAIEVLDDIIPAGTGTSTTELFSDFHNFAEMPGISAQRVEFDLGADSKLVIHPFRTTCTDPIWMNIGEARGQERDRLRGDLAKEGRLGKGRLHIVVMHHNPISSSAKVEGNFVNAYNSMPAGPQLMHTLQKDGVDLILHGHQHEDAKLLFDFDFQSTGHAYALGSLSSASPKGGGCNLLTINSINSGSVLTYRYTERGRRFDAEGKLLTLAFERNRPFDATTTDTRLEIKRFSWLETDDGKGQEMLWQEVQKPGASVVYISGKHLFRMAQDRASQDILLLLRAPSTTYVRILISNPDLISNLSMQAALWGTTDELDNLATTARQSLKHLESLVTGLSVNERARIDVRISHTVLPFAATVRDADEEWGKMVVRLLPVGAIGGITAPVLKLNRRADGALYGYYLRHFKALLGSGTSVLGEWNRGDADLVVEGLPLPKASGAGKLTPGVAPA